MSLPHALYLVCNFEDVKKKGLLSGFACAIESLQRKSDSLFLARTEYYKPSILVDAKRLASMHFYSLSAMGSVFSWKVEDNSASKLRQSQQINLA